MIASKMYLPSVQTLADVGLTNEIDAIQNPHGNIAEGYCMGYVTFDKMPDAFKLFFVKKPQTGETALQFLKPSPSNYSWGFVYERLFSNYSSTKSTMYYRDSNNNMTRYTGFDYYQTARFINTVQICKSTYPDAIALNYRYMFVNTGDFSDGHNYGVIDSTNNVYVDHTGSITLTHDQLKTAVTNNGTMVSISDTLAGESVSVDITGNNFNEWGVAIKTVNSTYSIIFIIHGWTANFYNNYAGYSGENHRIPILPFFLQTIPENNWNIPPQNNAVVIPSGLEKSFNVRWRNGSIYDYSLVNVMLGGWIYDEFDVISAETYGMAAGKCGVYKNKIYVRCDYSGMSRANFYSQYVPSDLFKVFQFFNKIQTGVTAWNDVGESGTYLTQHSAALFNESNNPTGERISGNYSAILSKLQPWQMLGIDITVSEYDPANLPPYDPTPGGAAENVGDSVIRPTTLGIGGTNGFVTQYALTAAQVQTLGEILWTSIFDTDYWQNYMFSLALDTGSFNVSSILSFFISLKVYPFDMIYVDSFNIWGSNLYIGTGIKPLNMNTTIHCINNYCDYVPGGSCTVDSSYFYHDYRDYINTKYTLYVPYCGTVELNPGDVVGNTITLQYAVDFATGGCIGYVDVNTSDGKQFTIAALPGQMGADVPLTSTAAGQVAARFIGDAMKFGGLLGGEIAGVASGIAGGFANPDKSPSGGSGSVLSGAAGMFGGLPAAVGMDIAPGAVSQAANMLTRGAVSAPMLSGGRGFASFGSPQTAYVQIRRGIYPNISGLASLVGSSSIGTYTINELSGFVRGDVKTDDLTCPENEKMQIKRLLANGIYV